jgi:hypothetical protein
MRFYLAYFAIFGMAALIAASGVSRFLFFSFESLAVFVAFVFLPGLLFLGYLRFRLPEAPPRGELSRRAVTWLFAAWAALAVFEIAAAGYVPLLELLGGNFVYTDFKPPTHGLTNALSLVFVCAAPFTAFRRPGLALATIVLFQFVILNRGPAFYHLLGYVIAFVASRPGILRRNRLRFLAGFAVAVLLFGLVGAVRMGSDFAAHEAFGIEEQFEWLPGTVVWALIYLSSPTSNLLFNLSHGELACQPQMLAILSTLVPGPLRNAMLGHEPTDDAYLPCEITGDLYYPGLNVSTGFVQYYIDFGPFGLVLGAVVVSTALWFLSRRPLARWGALEPIVCVVLFVNLFAPAFNQLSFVVSMALALALRGPAEPGPGDEGEGDGGAAEPAGPEPLPPALGVSDTTGGRG